MSDESIKSSSAPHNFLNPSLNYLGAIIRVTSSGKCLKQDKTTYIHWKFTLFMKYIKLTTQAVMQHYKMVCLVQLV